MKARKLVKIVFFKKKKYYLIIPCVTINQDDFKYTFPITKVEASITPEGLFEKVSEVMGKDCRIPYPNEYMWKRCSESGEFIPHPCVVFDRRQFKKDFGYAFGNIVLYATSIITMEHIPDDSYMFEMWSTDGMTKERITCPGGRDKTDIIDKMCEALRQSEQNRDKRPKYY